MAFMLPLSSLPEAHLHLQAVAPTRNVARDYHIRLSRDLFGFWLVDAAWGRIGGARNGNRHSFADPAQALTHIRALLARRAGAPRRIGVAYRLVEADEKARALYHMARPGTAAVPNPPRRLSSANAARAASSHPHLPCATSHCTLAR